MKKNFRLSEQEVEARRQADRKKNFWLNDEEVQTLRWALQRCIISYVAHDIGLSAQTLYNFLNSPRRVHRSTHYKIYQFFRRFGKLDRDD